MRKFLLQLVPKIDIMVIEREVREMANKKKKEVVGIISGYELTKKSMPHYTPSFRTGKYMTEKDKPRKKINKKNMDKYM